MSSLQSNGFADLLKFVVGDSIRRKNRPSLPHRHRKNVPIFNDFPARSPGTLVNRKPILFWGVIAFLGYMELGPTIGTSQRFEPCPLDFAHRINSNRFWCLPLAHAR